MNFNPFEPVSDYPKMLNKLAFYAFWASLLLVTLTRHHIWRLEDALRKLDVGLPIADLSLPVGSIAVAFGWAFVSRVFKFHDRISDVLRIRLNFDVEAILLPLCAASGGLAKAGLVREITARRHPLMRETFYKYASSGGKAVIDSHYITMALDQWASYWIILEAATLAGLTAAAFLFFGPANVAALLLFGVLGAMLLLQLIRRQCAEYALQEVELILEDPERCAAVGGQFRAL